MLLHLLGTIRPFILSLNFDAGIELGFSNSCFFAISNRGFGNLVENINRFSLSYLIPSDYSLWN